MKNSIPISAEAIRSRLGEAASELRFEVHDVLPSTNSTARQAAREGAAEGLVIIARQQTCGRGRGEHTFFSPGGSGVYMSLLLRPSLSPDRSLLITTAAAVAVADAIEAVSGREAGIKWVNDVYLGRRKVCGILTEAAITADGRGLEYAVLGIGINALSPTDGFPQELANTASCVADSSAEDPLNRLAAGTLSRFMELYQDLCSESILREYERRLFFLGEQITVMGGGCSRKATALGIDDRLHLLVRYEDGSEQALSSGEISIKL